MSGEEWQHELKNEWQRQKDQAWAQSTADGTMIAPAGSLLVCCYCCRQIREGELFVFDGDGDTCHPPCLEQALISEWQSP